MRLFYCELSTAWVHVASQAIYRFEPPELSGLKLAGFPEAGMLRVLSL